MVKTCVVEFRDADPLIVCVGSTRPWTMTAPVLLMVPTALLVEPSPLKSTVDTLTTPLGLMVETVVPASGENCPLVFRETPW